MVNSFKESKMWGLGFEDVFNSNCEKTCDKLLEPQDRCDFQLFAPGLDSASRPAKCRERVAGRCEQCELIPRYEAVNRNTVRERPKLCAVTNRVHTVPYGSLSRLIPHLPAVP